MDRTRLDSSIGRTDGLYPSDRDSNSLQGSCENCFNNPAKKRFCSLSCSATWQFKAKAWNIAYCLLCGKVINLKEHPENKFCNHSCSALYNNPRKKTKEKAKYRKYTKCRNCHTEDIKKGATKYCSFNCQQRYNEDRYLEQWLFGGISGSVKSGASTTIRRFMLDVYDKKCARCGWNDINPKTGKSPLELEHIDGNYKNNSFTNLIILCPNCHALTPTYKALNWGNGREWRIKESDNNV